MPNLSTSGGRRVCQRSSSKILIQSHSILDAASKLPPRPLLHPSPSSSTLTESFICYSSHPVSSPPLLSLYSLPLPVTQRSRGTSEKFGACNAFLTGTSQSFLFSLVSWGLIDSPVNPTSHTTLSCPSSSFPLFVIPSLCLLALLSFDSLRRWQIRTGSED